MEFVHKKTDDRAVENFLVKAAEKGVSLVWDRFEGQLPLCGFCETGLSCRDCLQGPCISHPFRDQSKAGICGKDKDTLGAHSLLRLVIQGTMGYLDQLTDFAKGVESGAVSPKDRREADRILADLRTLFESGGPGLMEGFPEDLLGSWKAAGIYPEGIGRDMFKASQKLEGGVGPIEDVFLWAFKSSLLGCLAQRLQGRLKKAVFGDGGPTKVEVNLGVLRKEAPNLLLYGHFSPILKQKIAEAAERRKVTVTGVCTDPLLPPYRLSLVTNYGSQEIPLLTGAVDLIVAGDQFVSPSLVEVAREWHVTLVPTEVLNRDGDPAGFAREIVEETERAFDNRRGIPREVPDVKESAVMGFSREDLDAGRIAEAMHRGGIKGIAILAGSNNVKYTQDTEIVSMTSELLKNEVLCISEGEASVSLAKYGFLNPQQRKKLCGQGVSNLLSSLGENTPPVLDFGGDENGGVVEFLLALARVEKARIRDYPIVACFAEANRSTEVTKAISTAAFGVPTYFWPFLPVTGSLKTTEMLSAFCREKFGSEFHVITEKMKPAAKASLLMQDLEGK